jgi:nitroreductase
MKRGKEVGHMKEIFNRRSIRKYADRPVEAEKIDRLLRAAMQAPSIGNQQSWEFIVVRGQETLEKLSRIQPFATQAARSAATIVLVANGDSMKAPVEPSSWQQEMGAAAQNILTEAVYLGLGAVWMGVATTKDATDKIRDCFGLPENIKPFAMISVGYPKGEENEFIDRYRVEKIHHEKW